MSWRPLRRASTTHAGALAVAGSRRRIEVPLRTRTRYVPEGSRAMRYGYVAPAGPFARTTRGDPLWPMRYTAPGMPPPNAYGLVTTKSEPGSNEMLLTPLSPVPDT